MGYDQRQLNNGEQGEGSGLNADQVDNSEGSELGNTIDSLSIVENAQGEIQVSENFYVTSSSSETEYTGNYIYSGPLDFINKSSPVFVKSVRVSNPCTIEAEFEDGTVKTYNHGRANDNGGGYDGNIGMPPLKDVVRITVTDVYTGNIGFQVITNE